MGGRGSAAAVWCCRARQHARLRPLAAAALASRRARAFRARWRAMAWPTAACRAAASLALIPAPTWISPLSGRRTVGPACGLTRRRRRRRRSPTRPGKSPARPPRWPAAMPARARRGAAAMRRSALRGGPAVEGWGGGLAAKGLAVEGLAVARARRLRENVNLRSARRAGGFHQGTGGPPRGRASGSDAARGQGARPLRRRRSSPTRCLRGPENAEMALGVAWNATQDPMKRTHGKNRLSNKRRRQVARFQGPPPVRRGQERAGMIFWPYAARVCVGLVVHQVNGELVRRRSPPVHAAGSACAAAGPSRQKRSTMASGTKSVDGFPARPWWA